jgi:hypothetical protein
MASCFNDCCTIENGSNAAFVACINGCGFPLIDNPIYGTYMNDGYYRREIERKLYKYTYLEF